MVLVDGKDVNFRTSRMGNQTKEEQLSYYTLLELLFSQRCRRRALLSYFNSGVADLHVGPCCDACDKQTLFSHIFGL